MNHLFQFREDVRKLARSVVDLADDLHSSNKLEKSDSKTLGDLCRQARKPLLETENLLVEIIERGR